MPRESWVVSDWCDGHFHNEECFWSRDEKWFDGSDERIQRSGVRSASRFGRSEREIVRG